MRNREVKTATLEKVDEAVDDFELPDIDLTEGGEPNYRIVIPGALLLSVGAFLLLRSLLKRYGLHKVG
jgi:hypothetical protein